MASYYNVPAFDVALVAATAKAVVSAIANASKGLLVRAAWVGFESVTVTDVAVLVELCYADTDGTGTANTTSITKQGQTFDDPLFTSKRNYSADPTTNIVVMKKWKVPPQGDRTEQNLPMLPQRVPAGKTCFMRCTAPQAQTCSAHLDVEEGA